MQELVDPACVEKYMQILIQFHKYILENQNSYICTLI